MEAEFEEEDKADALREYWREKYYRRVEGKVTHQLATWLKDESIKPSFKTFIKQCVWSHKAKCPIAFIKILANLDIALDDSNKKSDDAVDGRREGGGCETRKEEAGANSPADGGSEGEERERETYIQDSPRICDFMF